MLESLSIRHYALIDDAQIEFGPGLTVITGETGAGKSIILGALSLCLGTKLRTMSFEAVVIPLPSARRFRSFVRETRFFSLWTEWVFLWKTDRLSSPGR